jgi:hypothetical protein
MPTVTPPWIPPRPEQPRPHPEEPRTSALLYVGAACLVAALLSGLAAIIL